MNRDPFGLGVLLYGLSPVHHLTASAWAVGPLAEREFELAHESCSISTFCRNPLHPGPCKGWKKSLGVSAPGALKAIEKAHGEKVAAKRAATEVAKSAAQKRLQPTHLASPLHAKKSTVKNANLLLGDDEAKASKKADKVILNKAEIKKYSKIKAAHVNSIMAKHGMQEDTGLEDRIAEALAKDNSTGTDDHFQSALSVSADSLGAHLAVEHCHKGNHKECDDKVLAEVRDKFSAEAEQALKTGDDSGLDKAVDDYKSGKWTPSPKAEPKTPEPAKPAAPKSVSTPKDEAPDEAVSSVQHMTQGDWDDLPPQEKAKLTSAAEKAKADGTPGGDAAVIKINSLKKKTKPKAAPAKKAAPAPKPDEPKPEPKPEPKKADEPKAHIPAEPKKAAAPSKKKPSIAKTTPAAEEGKPFNVAKAEQLFGEHPIAASTSTKLALLDDMTPEEHGQLDDGTKGEIAVFLKDAADAGTMPALVNKIQTKLGGADPAGPPKSNADFLQELIDSVPMAGVKTPEMEKAVALAKGTETGTLKQKKTAYELLTADDFKALDAHEQQAIMSSIDELHDLTKVQKNKDELKDLKGYFYKATGGGAGAGGGVVHQVSMDKALDGIAALSDTLKPNGAPDANPDALKETFKAMVVGVGHEEAASMLSKTWSTNGLAKLDHVTKDFGGIDPGTIEQVKPAFEAEIKAKLMGSTEPSPLIDAFEAAVTTKSPLKAAEFLEQAHNASKALSTPTIGKEKDSVPGGAAPLGHFGESIAFSQDGTHSAAAQSVLFSAYKSAHSGTVLSHSIEDNYNNLLAVAAHYKGKKVNGLSYPDDLSVLQVARSVDKGIAQSLNVSNGNVLEKRIANWLQTPEGLKYATDHPQPGQKWVDNLAGNGAGATEAAKHKLTIGAPVGKRVQKPNPKVNGKAQAFDPHKSATDFKALTAEEITVSQTHHMDESGTPWSPGQAESLANYTTGSYHEMNAYLRGKQSGQPVDSISEIGLERVALVQAAMRPLQQDTRMHRGTGWEFLPPEYRTPAGARKLIGKNFQEPAFMSTTVSGEGGEFGGSVRLDIEAPAGTPAAWVKQISHNPYENEIVLAAGSKFKILGVTDGGMGPTVIRVRVVS